MEDNKVGILKNKKKKAPDAKAAETPVPPATNEPSIFKAAWNMLNNIRDDLNEPISLIRTSPSPGSKFVKRGDLKKPAYLELDDRNGNCPTIECYASTLPLELKLTVPKPNSDLANPTKPQTPLPEVFSSDVVLANKIKVPSKEAINKPKTSRSLLKNRSSTTATAEKNSSSGINSILDDKVKQPGTHRSNQAEATAQEYQTMLDGIQSHYPFLPDNSEKTKPKGILGSRSFARLSEMYGEATNRQSCFGTSNDQLYSNKNDRVPEYRPNATQLNQSNYLQTVNDQLFRVNHERKRQQMSGNCPMHFNILGRGNAPNATGSGQNEYGGINQNNNVNINLTLALSQVQQGGRYEIGVPMPAAAEAEFQELKAPRPRPVFVEAKIRNPKVETGMQTELLVQGDEAENSPFPSETPSTSAFPSAIPSDQIWRRKPISAEADSDGEVEGEVPYQTWTDYMSIPAALEYTNDSFKSIMETADGIINTCIIPPDDNPMSDEDMNAEEDKVAISLMRLMGIPKQLRHNIYQEALYNFTAIQEVSVATLDILGNLIDWMSNGDCDGKEELLSKIRIMASVTTDFDPGSEVWTNFERDIGLFTDAVGEAMKDGVEVVKKCSSTLIQNMLSSSKLALANPVTVQAVPSVPGRRDSKRQLPMSPIEEEEQGQPPRIPDRPSQRGGGGRSVSQGPQVRVPTPVLPDSLNDAPSLGRGRDEYRTDPMEALDVEISKLMKLRQTLQSNSSLSVETPTRPSVGGSNCAPVESAESLNSIEEPPYPDVQLVDGDAFEVNEDAEKRQLLRECRNTARTLVDDINSRRGDVAGASMSAFSRAPSRQYSEEAADEFVEEEPRFHRVTDALMEAPPGYDFGFTGAISSACSSIRSSILSQAQSAVSYLPIFQGDTPILGQSQSESRDERMEMEPEERYHPNLKNPPQRMGRSTSKLRFAEHDEYFEDASSDDDSIPEPTIPAPPAVPKRHNHSVVVDMDGFPRTIPASRRDSLQEEHDLPFEEGLSQLSLPDSQLLDTNDASMCTSVTGTDITEVSECSTPEHPLFEASSIQLNTQSSLPTVVDDAASNLSVLMEQLKPYWPAAENLSPDEQMKIAMNAFVAAQSQKVAQFLGNADSRVDSTSTEPTTDQERPHSGTESTGSYRKQKPQTETAMPSQEEKAEELTGVDFSAGSTEDETMKENTTAPVKTETSEETTQLHKKLNQLEKIVQDMCSEVTGTKLDATGQFEPSFVLTEDEEKALKASSSRIPVSTGRVKTPFALPPRHQESATTINLLPPKNVMVTTSCLSVDSTLGRRTEPANAPRSNYLQFPKAPPNRGGARHSAFGRSISSTPQSAARLQQKAPVNSNQRAVPMNKPSGIPQRKPASGSTKPVVIKIPASKWIAPPSSGLQSYRQSRRSSPSPSRQDSQTVLLSRSNSYRELFQKKQNLIGKTTAPIQIRKPGAGNQDGQRKATTGYSSRSSRTRAPLIPTGRDPSRGRTDPVYATAPALVADNNMNIVGCSGGYLSAHGSGSRVHIPVHFVDTNANRWQPTTGLDNIGSPYLGTAAESQGSQNSKPQSP